MLRAVVVAVFAAALLFSSVCAAETEAFLDSWAVRITPGEDPDAVAASFGMINHGQVSSLEGFYHFSRPSDAPCPDESASCVHRRSRRDDSHTQALASHPSIEWAQQQVAKSRVRRYIEPTDPMYKSQWYLGDSTFPSINQLPVWKEGITGKGVVLCIVDDGLEHNNPELTENYDPKASYDFNDGDDDPAPRYSSDNINKHGTRCAGAASGAQNSHCGVGVAPKLSTGGIRMLDGPISDIVEGGSLAFKPQYIDIYSCSWGPNDDGRTFEAPGVIATKAIRQGVRVGRGGLGSIYVWASGNGGSSTDNCNCDGYANAIETIGIGSASQHGAFPYYSEPCTARLAVTFSSGQASEPQIVSADLHQSCTDRFTGTSASAPLAAGILGLVLEVNPCLTWRDMQHLIVQTSSRAGLQGNTFSKNGAGFYVSHEFGFGLLDAGKLVEAARKHVPVASQAVVATPQRKVSQHVSGRGTMEDSVGLNGCDSTGELCIEKLEHVQVVLTIYSTRRGDVTVTLVSPSGTVSNLLTTRPRDDNATGIIDWTFMTTHCWGENPQGTWSISVKCTGPTTETTFVNWALILRGTLKKETLLSGDPVAPVETPASERPNPTMCKICGQDAYADGEGGCRACSQNCTNGCFGPTAMGCSQEEAEFLTFPSRFASDANKIAILAVLGVLCVCGVLYAYLSMREKAFYDARNMGAVYSIEDEEDDPFSANPAEIDDETRRHHLEFFSRARAGNNASNEIQMARLSRSPPSNGALVGGVAAPIMSDSEGGEEVVLDAGVSSASPVVARGSVEVVVDQGPRRITINTASSSLEASEDEDQGENATLLNN